MEKGKKKKASAVTALLLVISVAAAVLVVFCGIYFHKQKKAEKHPDVTPDSDIGIGSELADLIYEASETAEFTDIALPELSNEEMFSKYDIRETYYQECTVSHGAGEDAFKQVKHILRDGKCWNVRTYEGDKLTETLICDGKTIYIRNEITGKGVSYPMDSENTPEAFAALPDHTEIVRLTDDYREHAADKTSVLSKCTYSLYRTSDLNMLMLVLNYKEANLTERYYYYLDYGMIYHCESSIGGNMTYSMTTTVFTPDITGFVTDASFSIPK